MCILRAEGFFFLKARAVSLPREKLGGFSFREQPKGFRGGFFPEEDALPLLVCVLGSARVCEGVKYHTMKAGCRLGYRELPGVQKCNTWGSPFERWRGGEKDSFQPLPGKKNPEGKTARCFWEREERRESPSDARSLPCQK